MFEDEYEDENTELIEECGALLKDVLEQTSDLTPEIKSKIEEMIVRLEKSVEWYTIH
jgi:hypothetical protein